MQDDDGTLRFARVLFWICVVVDLAGFWWAIRRVGNQAPNLVPSALFAGVAFVLFVLATLRAVRRLPTLPPAAAQREMLTVSALGLIVVSFALRLR